MRGLLLDSIFGTDKGKFNHLGLLFDFHDQFSVHAGPIYGLYNLSFGYVGPYFHLHQTKNTRFAKFAEQNCVALIAEKDKGAGSRHITFCHYSSKIWGTYREIRQRRPLSRLGKLF